MEWIKISNSLDLYRFRPEDIVFVAADGNYTDLKLFNGKTYKFSLQLHVFTDIFASLQRNPFVRVGKSVMVNTDYIEHISLPERRIVLYGRDFYDVVKIDVSEKAIKDLKQLMEGENKVW